MGFRYKRYHKGIYIDGHERADVVEYRQQFLTQMAKYVIFIYLFIFIIII